MGILTEEINTVTNNKGEERGRGLKERGGGSLLTFFPWKRRTDLREGLIWKGELIEDSRYLFIFLIFLSNIIFQTETLSK